MAIDKKILLEIQKLPPKEAMAYLESLGISIGLDYQETKKLVEKRLFAITKAASMDVVKDIKSEIQKALKNGVLFKDFANNVENLLVKKGWYGRAIVENGVKKAIPPYRLKTIYDTNMNSALNAGRLEKQRANADDRPYLKLIEIDDKRTRDNHRKQNGSIAKITHPFWKKWYPPNGYNCRARTSALTKEEAMAAGIKIKRPDLNPDPGFNRSPDKFFEPEKEKYDSETWKLGQTIKPKAIE